MEFIAKWEQVVEGKCQEASEEIREMIREIKRPSIMWL